jgi:hypothetical protein
MTLSIEPPDEVFSTLHQSPDEAEKMRGSPSPSSGDRAWLNRPLLLRPRFT